MKLIKSMTFAAIFALAFSVVPVAASVPAAVSIVSDMAFTDPATGTFVATGPAVDAGILCETGTVLDVSAAAYGWQSKLFVILRVHKHFRCDDNSGTFEMNMIVRLVGSITTARWVTSGGTGDYATLIGTGYLTGSPTSGGITDTYTGILSN